MTKNTPYIRTLLQKYVDNTICREEYEELLRWFVMPDKEEDRRDYIQQLLQSAYADDIDHDMLSQTIARVDQKIEDQILSDKPRIPLLIKKLYPYAAAALVLFFIGIAVYYNSYRTEQDLHPTLSDIDPGSNRATLTFEGGDAVNLSESQSGIVIGENITYTDGSIVLEKQNTPPGIRKDKKSLSYATLHTPRGGQYRITLPDGSKVFLNAASSLRYPSRFEGDRRIVELHGEAYFEVSHDKNKPFVVLGDKQQIHVLGTTFNISDYPGEPVATTLLSGSIALNLKDKTTPILMKPGQQAVVNDNRTNIRHVDAEDYKAWTRDLFVFNDAPLTDIMKQLERWYDIEVSYPPDFREENFYAEVPRNRKLSEVLRSLERSSNFKFEQQERRVIVHQ